LQKSKTSTDQKAFREHTPSQEIPASGSDYELPTCKINASARLRYVIQ